MLIYVDFENKEFFNPPKTNLHPKLIYSQMQLKN